MPAPIQHDAAACGAICESPAEPGIGLWSRSTWDPVTALQHKKQLRLLESGVCVGW